MSNGASFYILRGCSLSLIQPPPMVCMSSIYKSAASASRTSHPQYCGQYIQESLQLDVHGRPEEPKQSHDDEIDGNDVVE